MIKFMVMETVCASKNVSCAAVCNTLEDAQKAMKHCAHLMEEIVKASTAQHTCKTMISDRRYEILKDGETLYYGTIVEHDFPEGTTDEEEENPVETYRESVLSNAILILADAVSSEYAETIIDQIGDEVFNDVTTSSDLANNGEYDDTDIRFAIGRILIDKLTKGLKTNVTVVVDNGCVDVCYADRRNVSVSILDMDSTDPDEADTAKKELRQLQKDELHGLLYEC